MNSSMINAMVSMNGLQKKLDVMADNVANVNTVGYKRKEATFQDLLNTVYEQPGEFQQQGRLTPLGFSQGWGSRLSVIQPNLEQGPITDTGNVADLAIQGNAMFEVIVDGAGNRAYTRNGAFQLTVNGNGDTILATAEGYPVVANVAGREGPIVVPDGYKLRVNPDGSLQGVKEDGAAINLGTLKIMQPSRPAALTQVADNLFAVAGNINVDDVLQRITPNADNGVAILQGALEQSNVNLTDELTELINVQRAYQLAARAITSSDTMMGLANSLRR
ncbi:flagellar hook-basal body protein [Paenibacillus radicis (ex Gao et al. 2016)]|uniref:Flagellar basal body rod protein FlgG n=1 Tax=Paenibacillus radicis (ex Gao et al. 2016) TaxID=1737354 RepID=A0A917HNA9_9BACL|nr:flagellar hook-basal body protein [Paenibacillus radicis (ex Gao et al. 2016)]GGG84264.1 flagellar basal body rod protein FlgG [Paenibacillus radicis (ex Gao et al. 2016)]